MSDLLRRLLTTADMAYHWRGQSRYALKPLPQILAGQDRRLRGLVIHAHRTVRYYHWTMQHVGLQPLDLQTAEDLSRVPLLLREEVRRDLGYYVSIAELLSRNVHLDSSRTTAWRCPIYHDVRTLCLNGAHGARARSAYVGLLVRQWGYRQTRIVEPRGSVAYVELSWEHHALLPSGVRLKRQLLSAFECPQRTIEAVDRFRPDVLWSLRSALDQLFAHLRSTGQDTHRSRVIVSGADELAAPARRLIEEGHGVPAYGGFGAVQAPNIGCECECDTGHHISVDLCGMRVADDDGWTLPDGKSGPIAIANLPNRGTVLLKYGLGGVGRVQHDVCPCRRTLPRLVELQGTSDDFATALE